MQRRRGRRLLWQFTVFLALAGLLISTSAGLAKTKVTYWDMHGRAKHEEALIKKFNETHPDVEVELIPVPGSYANSSHLVAAEVSGELPDLIYVDRGMITDLKLSGILKDLTPYVQKEGWVLEKEWFPATLGTVTHKGRYYGIPRDGFPMSLLAWNKRLFSESGLDPNTPPDTLDDLYQFHKRLTRTNGEDVAEQVGYIPWAGLGQFGLVESLLWGSNWWDPEAHEPIVDGRRNVEMMQWIGSWAQDLQPQIDDSWLAGWGANAFSEEKLGMAMVNSANIIQYEKDGLTPNDIGVAPFPSPPGETAHRLYMAGEGFGIPAKAKNADAAWELMTWLLEADQAAVFAQNSGVPPARLSSARFYMNEFAGPLYAQMMKASFKSEVVAIPGTPLDIPAWLEMQKALKDVSSLKKDPQSALAEAQSVVKGKLKDYVDKNGAWW